MPFPKGATPSEPGTPPIGSVTLEGENRGNFKPELLGIPCQIQHPTESGKGWSEDAGLLGTGIVMTPIGPVAIIQAKHADGTSLGAILTPDEFASFIECLVETGDLLAAARKSGGTA